MVFFKMPLKLKKLISFKQDPDKEEEWKTKIR
jgi:hypothetical protein